MTRPELLALLPLVLLALTPVLVLLGVAIRRSHAMTAWLTLAGLGAAAATCFSEITLLGLGTILAMWSLGIHPRWRHVVVDLGATAVGASVLVLSGGAAPVAATGAALAAYLGILILFRIVTAEDVTMVVGWIREAAMR